MFKEMQNYLILVTDLSPVLLFMGDYPINKVCVCVYFEEDSFVWLLSMLNCSFAVFSFLCPFVGQLLLRI